MDSKARAQAVVDVAEEEADLELTLAELDFTEGVRERETWEAGQCSCCGRSNLDGIGGLCIDCLTTEERRAY